MEKLTQNNMREVNITCPPYLAKDLDEEQKKAVESPIGNICVNAIAGSGKTRVLTYRVANLIANNFAESQMMLLTFTNKAAGEMIERIQTLLQRDKLALLSGTFHSVACKFLRKYASDIGYSHDFTILDTNDELVLFNEIRLDYLEQNQLEDKQFPAKNVLLSIYSGKINHNLTTEEYIDKFCKNNVMDRLEHIENIFETYVETKHRSMLMDFDDLLLNFMYILEKKEIQLEINKAYPLVFVDEYQDINWIQHAILESLNMHQTLFIIGDESQCIYQFRGSDESYIRNFTSTHKAQKYKLTYNYRSTPEVLKIAEDSINNNDVKEYVNLHAKQSSGEQTEIHEFETDTDQAYEMARIIKNEHQGNYNNIAILVRSSFQARGLETAFRDSKVPYKLVGMLSTFEKEQIKDLIAFMQFKENPNNEVAFIRIAKLFPGIGRKTMKKIYAHLFSIKFDYEKCNLKVSEKISNSLNNIIEIMTYETEEISEWIEFILRNFYTEYLFNRFDNGDERYDEITKSFIPYCDKFKTMSELLQDIALFSNDQKENREDTNKVTVMTMHRAKGLEWDIVFLPGISKFVFPKITSSREYLDNSKQIQNERNLFYVAITRARKKLYITYFNKAFRNANAGPSPFIKFDANDNSVEQNMDKTFIPYDFDFSQEIPDEHSTNNGDWSYEIDPKHYLFVSHVKNFFKVNSFF